MSWPVVLDAYRTVSGQAPQYSAEQYVAAQRAGKDWNTFLLFAARRAKAYDALALYDREPNDLNLKVAADAMVRATQPQVDGENSRQVLLRLLPQFPPREAPMPLLQLIVSSAARERRLGETLGHALDRVCTSEEALRWAHDVVCDR